MEEIFRLFAENVEYYDSWYHEPSGRAVLEAEAKMLDTELPKGVGADIGAGTCVFPPLLSREREIICVEPVYEMLSYGRKRCQHHLVSVGELLPLVELNFAYMVTVVEFLKDPIKVGESIYLSLKNGGILAVLFINRESTWGKTYQQIAAEGKDPILSRAKLYNLEEIKTIFEKAGFKYRKAVASLYWEPFTVPAQKRIYSYQECRDCGAVLAVFEKP